MRPSIKYRRYAIRLGSVLGSILLAALAAMTFELLALAFAGPNNPAGQALARSSEDVIALEKHLRRGGTMLGYPIQY